MSSSVRLKELLADNTMPSAPELVVRGEEGRVRCLACGHRCKILPGRSGVCRVRFNTEGELRAPAGYIAGLQIDPIEKKPFYHAFPATHLIGGARKSGEGYRARRTHTQDAQATSKRRADDGSGITFSTGGPSIFSLDANRIAVCGLASLPIRIHPKLFPFVSQSFTSKII